MLKNEYFRCKKTLSNLPKLSSDFASSNGGHAGSVINWAKLIYREQNRLESDIMPQPKFYSDAENPYANRILDALSRMLYVGDADTIKEQKDLLVCCAVSVVKVKEGYKFYVAYNNPAVQKTKEIIEEVFDTIKTIVREGLSWENLVNYCLGSQHYFYCKEFKETLKLSTDRKFGKLIDDLTTKENGNKEDFVDLKKSFAEGEVGELISQFLTIAKDMPTNYEDLNQHMQELTALKDTILGHVETVFEEKCPVDTLNSDSCKKDIIDIIDQFAQRKIFACQRLLNDCYKVVKYFNQSILSEILYMEFQDIVFDDTKDVHAEMKILRTHMNLGLEAYIGISKLSCWVCDLHIRHAEEANESHDKQILHFGTSDVAYPPQNLPSMFYDLRNNQKVAYVMNKMTARVLNCSGREVTDDQIVGLDPSLQYRPLSPFDELLVPVIGADGAGADV